MNSLLCGFALITGSNSNTLINHNMPIYQFLKWFQEKITHLLLFFSLVPHHFFTSVIIYTLTTEMGTAILLELKNWTPTWRTLFRPSFLSLCLHLNKMPKCDHCDYSFAVKIHARDRHIAVVCYGESMALYPCFGFFVSLHSYLIIFCRFDHQ